MDAISCLAPSFADAAIARALHFSSTTAMSPGDSSSSSHHHPPFLADLPSTYYAATCCDSVLVSDSPRRRSSPTGRQKNHALAPAARTKRRSRASKRAPTTYISTDAANFRLMVQQITGAQPDAAASDAMTTMLQVQATALLGAGNAQLLPAGDEASALRQHQLQHQQPCFPTLDSSWNVMYDTNSAEML